ncbi:uncharacterized protein BXZ73DRAFT_86989 [Epithele typhae]|uniref:uncharacterized protein n=1 Tax=Epithele typhae TaxID=378194 RepID=UPI00200898B9|nr:uncharacterized protein BXZ73DRAFT_86989 [Epithele typhae]KAH9944011.1 hypothetical protein BXZ73DRAFT_86989 [Epithele typhae]
MLTPSNATHSPATNQTKRSSKPSTQSLNHLLNFTLPPRQPNYNQSIPRRARKTGAHHGVWNKERFVNAQYRFMMNPNGDYTVHFADPDIYFQWQDILQVIVSRGDSMAALSADQSSQDGDVLTCPICLSPPTAPRMTKCGHIYCFPCLLHLISTSEQPKSVRCPICHDSVNEWQLKAVKWMNSPSQNDADDIMEGSSSSASLDQDLNTSLRNGSTLKMRLIQRPQITTLALPRSSTWPSDLLPPHQAPFHFLPDVKEFAKFMLATPAELVADLSKDLDDLATERRLLAGMGDELGSVFLDAADAKVRHQIEKASALDTPFLREVAETARHIAQQLTERATRDRQRKEASLPPTLPEELPEAFLAIQGSGHTTAPVRPPREVNSIPTSGRVPRQRRNLNPPPPSTSTYYYYQAAGGLPIFLHPLDIKILFSHFHSYPAFPDEITLRVESITPSTVNDDLRKRCKYLAHLPEGADVVFVESDLTGVVGGDGLRPFENALRLRRTKRKEKGRRDDKARARTEERERERLAQTWGLPAARSRPSPPQTAPGAWGARSFASTAHAASARPLTQRTPVSGGAAARRDPDEDEWELDIAFHELEQRSAKAGGKKKGSKMVVLGSGGGRRAR